MDHQGGFVRPDVERDCGLTTDHPIDEHVLVLLELVDGAERGVVERSAGRTTEIADVDQRLLHAGDGFARVADAQLALVDLAAGICG